MKGIFIVIDGMGDVPHKLLGNKTPLEAAETPNLDFLATRGEMGVMYPVKPGFTPESDESLLSLFGNDLTFNTRGQFEALGAGLALTRGDLAMRANFATVDSSGTILDRRTGRTLSAREISLLSKELNKIPLSVSFSFVPTLLHQAVLVLKGGFSENVLGNDSTYIQGKAQELVKVREVKALDEEDNAAYTANVLNEFVKKANEVLAKHFVNDERKKRGLLSANYLLLRSPGIEPPPVKQYKKWLGVCYYPLEKGFATLSGMDVLSFDYPSINGIDSYAAIWDGLKRASKFAVKVLKKYHKYYAYAYVHINEVDLAGHDNKPLEKKLMLEYLDKTLFKFLRSFAPPKKIAIVVSANHATPCKLKGHSDEPVPVLWYNNSLPREKTFNETEARKGTLGRMNGKELLKRVGFVS